MIEKIKENCWKIKLKNFGSRVYVLKWEGKNIVVDTSSEQNREELIKNFEKLGILPEKIDIVILTHRHFDHIQNAEIFKNAKVYGSKEDFSEDEKVLDANKLRIKGLKIIKTPGHSRGGISIYVPELKILFSGDTLFKDGLIGRTDLPGGSEKDMIESLKKINKLDYEILLPGHI